MKTHINETCMNADRTKENDKIAPHSGIGRLSDSPKLKELLDKYGSQRGKDLDDNPNQKKEKDK